jgi:hypothetical protein
MISAGSGGGKSVTGRTIIAQLVHNGARAIIFDVAKRGRSHVWARDVPGIVISRTVQDAHARLIALSGEMDQRYEKLEADDSTRFQRVLICMEEMNATINRLNNYWTEVRKATDPKISPAVQALADILFAGREGRMHVIAVAQLMTARTIGGPEARENFAVRIMARYSMNAWKMLCPEIWPPPRSTRKTGRAQVVIGGQAYETQVGFLSDAEAIEWATSGVAQPDATAPTTLKAVEDRYTLAAISRENVVAMSYDALRQAKRRDHDFPMAQIVSGKETYSVREIRQWFDNRQSAAS